MDRFNPALWRIEWAPLAEAALLLGVAVIAALLLHRIIFAIVGKIARLSDTQVDDLVLAHVKRPVKWAMLAIAVTLAAQADKELSLVWEPLARFVRPALLGWIVYTLVKALTAALEYRLDISDDPIAVRSRRISMSVVTSV